SKPKEVAGLRDVVEVAAHGNTTCARSEDAVACWGDMPLGIAESASPVVVPDSRGARSVAVGDEHACLVTEAGEVRCWGSNNRAQCGQPKSRLLETPTAVPGVSGARRVVAGSHHTCALLEGGEVV